MARRQFGVSTALAAIAACAWLAGSSGRACSQAVTLSGSFVGSTPATLGYNVGHFHNNQTASWWRYAGVNGARTFTSPSVLTPTSLFRSSTNSSLNATSQAQFLSQRTALRNTGTAETFINWSGLSSKYTSNLSYGSNDVDAQFLDSTVRLTGGKTLVVMQRTPASYAWPANPSDNSAADWQNRWLGWQQWYAQAFVRARNENVENFQIFNEPDLYGSNLSQSRWIEMMKYGANAVESAIADVNRLFGRNLKAHIYGPVTNGPSLTPTGGTDWGDTLLQNRNTPVLSGTAASGYQLFDHFDYHNYGSNPTTFGTKLAGAITDVNTLTGGQGASYPVTISEFNTRTSASYDPADPVNNPNGYTPDSLAMSSRLGQICVNLANNKPDELYLFKFSNAGGANNGVHWQSASGNVGGATKSANVYRLFAKGFTDKDLLATPTTADADISLVAARDRATGARYVMAANADTAAAHALTLDLAPWGVAAGTRVTVEQVSDRFAGNISQSIDVGASRTITVNTDAGGVVLVKVPENQAGTRTVISASQDAYVRQANSTTNFGTATSLLVQSGSGSGSRYVSYLQFPLAGVDVANLTEATLGVYGWDPGATGDAAAGIIGHVYGLTSSTWTQSSIKWSNAPNINNSSSYGTITGQIDDNYTTGIGSSAEIIGQIAATGTERLLSLDVGGWVQSRIAAGATTVSFMITRDFRFDGDLDQTHSLMMRSTEYAGGTFSPTLTVMSVPKPPVIVVGVASGTQTQAQAGFMLLSGTTPVQKTGAGTMVLDQANTLTGPTTVAQGALQLGNATALLSSAVTVAAGATLTVGAQVAAVVPTLANNGLVNVGRGGLTVTGGQTATGIVAGIKSGRADGTWSGTSGITSSGAAATTDRAVGWIDNGNGSFTVAFAAAGDWNLNGTVDFDDVVQFVSAGRYDTGLPATWADGDYDYNGVVDFDDVVATVAAGLFDAGAYNTSRAGAGPIGLAAGTVAVPEPAAWILTAFVGLIPLTGRVFLVCKSRRIPRNTQDLPGAQKFDEYFAGRGGPN